MTEDTIGQTPQAPPTPPTERESPEALAQRVSKPTPDWYKALDTANVNELRKHPRFAGMLGSDLEKRTQQLRQQWEEEYGPKSLELIKKAHDEAREIALKESQDHRNYTHQTAREALAQRIGSHVSENVLKYLPDEKRKAFFDEVTTALKGADEDEVFAIYTHHAVKHLADAIAEQRLNKYRGETLAKEREAMRKELAAMMLKDSDAPDIARPRPAGKRNAAEYIKSMSPEEFENYWQQHKQSLQEQ